MGYIIKNMFIFTVFFVVIEAFEHEISQKTPAQELQKATQAYNDARYQENKDEIEKTKKILDEIVAKHREKGQELVGIDTSLKSLQEKEKKQQLTTDESHSKADYQTKLRGQEEFLDAYQKAQEATGALAIAFEQPQSEKEEETEWTKIAEKFDKGFGKISGQNKRKTNGNELKFLKDGVAREIDLAAIEEKLRNAASKGEKIKLLERITEGIDKMQKLVRIEVNLAGSDPSSTADYKGALSELSSLLGNRLQDISALKRSLGGEGAKVAVEKPVEVSPQEKSAWLQRIIDFFKSITNLPARVRFNRLQKNQDTTTAISRLKTARNFYGEIDKVFKEINSQYSSMTHEQLKSYRAESGNLTMRLDNFGDSLPDQNAYDQMFQASQKLRTDAAEIGDELLRKHMLTFADSMVVNNDQGEVADIGAFVRTMKSKIKKINELLNKKEKELKLS